MKPRKSRYDDLKSFEEGPYDGFLPRPILPATGIVEHNGKQGARMDQLGRHYFSSDRLWWRIADANPQALFADDLVDPLDEGGTILIPRAKE